MTLLSFLYLEMVDRISCSFTLVEAEVRLTNLSFPESSFNSFLKKGVILFYLGVTWAS